MRTLSRSCAGVTVGTARLAVYDFVYSSVDNRGLTRCPPRNRGQARDMGIDGMTLTTVEVPAEPYPFTLAPATTALLLIDFQRDFLEPGGFGELLGNDVSLLARAVAPTTAVLAATRAAGMLVIHTREGHRPDLSDAPPAKLARGRLETGIGSPGPRGRILVRGELGHDIVDALAPRPDEVVLDKPGKGSFYATDLELILRNHGIRSLVVTGVTTEVCVHTTVREANDRGFECLVLADCVGSYFPEFHEVGLRMIAAQGGIFGWVTDSGALLAALGVPAPTLELTGSER
jgi:biuret amidohydrolase